MSVKEMLKKIPIVHRCGVALKDAYKDGKAISVLKQERRIPRTGPVRVGFFCQYLPGWTKVKTVYEQMKADPRFEPYLLCVPSGIEKGALRDPDCLENDTYEYLRAQGYDEAINLLTGRDTWLELQTLGLSYVFYPRPYNPLMPRCYQTDLVARYCRVCIIMYGMATTEQITNILLNKGFMRYTYFYFAETVFSQRINMAKNPRGHKAGLQKTLSIGYPVLEQLARMKGVESPSWSFSKNDFRVIWAPRWTTSKEEGGSNFFTYKDAFLEYAQSHPDMDFLFRPHPLMFDNFVKTGEMTPAQVAEFKAACDGLPNVKLDDQPQYEATFWGSDVLVSDISGMIPEYFTTGKPIAFCATNMELKLAQFSEEMIGKGCYTVNSRQELFACLEALQRGEDPLAQKRKELIPELFGAAGEGASKRILEVIAQDAAENQ